MTDILRRVHHLSREQEERHTSELAAKLNLPYINLSHYPLTREVLEIVPKDQSLRFQVIPYLKVGPSVKVGLVHPQNQAVRDFLAQHGKTVGLQFALTVISQSSFLYGMNSYETLEKKGKAPVEQGVIQEHDDSLLDEIKDISSVATVAIKATVTRLLDVIILGALKVKASDIHLEPEEDKFLVRYRVDGVLQDVVRLPLSQFRQVASRIKYLSKLRMDISNLPQDGRFSVKGLSGGEIDLRVSIMPSTFGESVVMRLLGQERSILALDKLGFRDDALAAAREAISKPHGMILTSGPTGSGKSSTLYAILMELKKPGVKIITLEDPVEYRIDGLEQSQVRPGSGYEFADGLRASLRQDPDILMVGEIRDKETAEIAVQAALTGHLLLSTIHANSAPAVFVRLLEMGVKPFLLAGSMNLVMAQRLVRKICTNCREQYEPRPEIWQEVEKILEPVKAQLAPSDQKLIEADRILLTRGKGCDKCNKTGFSGRRVIIEILVPNDTIEAMIARSVSISEFEKVAIGLGMITMEQDGLLQVLHGETTVEEVWRVTKD